MTAENIRTYFLVFINTSVLYYFLNIAYRHELSGNNPLNNIANVKFINKITVLIE